MQTPSTFQCFIQDLLKKLELPIDGRIGRKTGSATAEHLYQIEVIEGQAGNVAFCVRLGLAADALSASGLRKLLAQNLPRATASSNIVGLHPKEQELCLWCRTSMENLEPASCIDMLNRLIRQAEELRRYFDAPPACKVDRLSLVPNTNFDTLQ